MSNYTDQEVHELKRENQNLKEKVMVLEGKETELRRLIAYLNKLGPKPPNMEP